MPLLLRCWLVCLALGGLAAQARAQDGAQRVALLVGSNDGGPRRHLLRHAQSDAEAMARVLAELGGVAPADQFLLRDPTQATLRQALRQIEARVLQTGPEHSEVLVYYSGHADQQGLLLGGERFAYDELRLTLEELPARVRVAIVDSCASGAMVRDKGGARRPPIDAGLSSDVRGYALLTSATADEAAQESDILGSSFFTHSLVTGLRGAADRDGDGQVTIAEAYGFAYDATLAETVRSSSGPQHPAYDMRLSGTGELVLTNLRQGGAGLDFEPESSTRAWVRDGSGRLMAEFQAGADHPVRVGLAPGAYVLTLRRDERWAELRMQLKGGQRLRVTGSQLTWREAEPHATRGPRQRGHENGLLHWPLRVNTLPTRADPQVVEHLAINLLLGRSAWLHGFALGTGGSWVDRDAHGVMLSVGTNLVGGSANGLQIAGGLNRTGRHVRAWQLAGGANLTRGYLRGFQLAGGLNRVRGPAAGIQLAGATNLAGHELAGLQVAAAFNYSAERVLGVQAAATNLAPRVDGLQLGLVNIAGSVWGLQLGLVNVARKSRASVGLINVIRDGRNEVHVVSTAREPGGLELHTGGDLFYSLLGWGMAGDRTQAWRWGLGGAVPIREHRLALEGLVGWYGPAPSETSRALLVQPRLVWECPLAGPLDLVLGPTWDLWIPFAGNTNEAPGWLWRWKDDGCTDCFRHGPGFAVGLGVGI